MARIICSWIAVVGLLVGMPLTASAHDGSHRVTKREVHSTKRGLGKMSKWQAQWRGTHPRRVAAPTNAVPELDPGAAGAALTLLAGGALAFTGRRRRANA